MEVLAAYPKCVKFNINTVQYHFERVVSVYATANRLMTRLYSTSIFLKAPRQFLLEITAILEVVYPLDSMFP